MADFWNDLVTTALLGTDKQMFDESLLPESIRAVVQKTDKKDKEALFYTTAALAHQYYKAGSLPQKIDLLAPAPCEPESQPYVSTAAITLLRKILEQEKDNQELLDAWLSGCIRKGWVVVPDRLVELLDIGLNSKHKYLQPKIKAVAGKRGQWLVQFYSEWKYLQDPDYLLLWEDGSTAERKTALQALRQSNPAQARELLAKSWAQESAKTRLELLPVLEIHLNPDDETFLTQVLEEIQVVRQKKPDAQNDLLAVVVDFLLRLPDSQLSLEVWELMKAMYQGQLIKEKKVMAPTQETTFFNVANLYTRLGIWQKNTIDNWSELTVTVSRLLFRYIPPSRWESHSNLSKEDFLLFLDQGAGFLESFLQAIALHKETSWAMECIRLEEENQVNTHTIQQGFDLLLPLLEPAQREAFFMKKIKWRKSTSEVWNALLSHSSHFWSLEFSKYVVSELGEESNSTRIFSLLARMSNFLHPDICKEDLVALLPSTVQPWVKSQFERMVIYPLKELMALRLEMQQAFAEEK
jgi:hypothetical protein